MAVGTILEQIEYQESRTVLTMSFRIYSELADQYKVLDAASAMAKRHVLADHLKEVIDTLEQKASRAILHPIPHDPLVSFPRYLTLNFGS